ncbi:ABC transporter ATP-binding protein [Desulfomonile tiedjei]|uniref:ABC transporter ATP-binding protein n=1 Tax=Desulfomonile tiedjei TaxID=2358 RepID=UPI003EB7471A
MFFCLDVHSKGKGLLISLNVCKCLRGAQGPFVLHPAFTIPRGQFVVLNGTSGTGKTTLLRMLAGLETPDDGRILVDGETWFDKNERVCVPPQKRSIGFVFQNYALFPSMTVRRNLEFAAGRRKDPRVDMFLSMIELEELQYRYPEELSGGQQQRVALARALIRRPKILLLDEPLSALDEAIREKLQEEILRLHQELGLTSILVSHDRAEILRMGDRILVLQEGGLTCEGPPFHIITRPDEKNGSGVISAGSGNPARRST